MTAIVPSDPCFTQRHSPLGTAATQEGTPSQTELVETEIGPVFVLASYEKILRVGIAVVSAARGEWSS
ncbi:MAG: hypothetical protein WCO60_15570 [Verrucomicrobiota bacterium]